MKQLATEIGKMKTGKKSKYPNYYCSGNNMVIGVNNNADYNTAKDEYLRIENKGNVSVQFYGVKIGDTKSEADRKFSKYNIRT